MISLIAPIIGGTIAQNLGYRPLFAVSLVMAHSALLVTLRFLRNTQMEEMHEVAVSFSIQRGHAIIVRRSPNVKSHPVLPCYRRTLLASLLANITTILQLVNP